MPHNEADGSADEQWQRAFNNPAPIGSHKKQALLQGIHQQLEKYRRRKRQLVTIGISAAAAILVTVFIKLPAGKTLIETSQWRELASQDAAQKILLEDGSVLWLAPHSAIKVYPGFREHRSTLLTKGTVFFSVAKDAKHPFSIAVNRQQVTVLGTAFTIRKIDSIDLQLTVKEGKVALDNTSGRSLLTAGMQVHTANAITGAVENIQPSIADWWTQAAVRWHNVPLEEIIQHVETYYQVKLQHGPVNGKKKISITWDLTVPLEENLAVLNALTGYEIH